MGLDHDGVELATVDALVSFDDRRVLEIGCGDGRFTFRYAERASSVLGVDPDDEAIGIARRETPRSLRGRVRFEAANAAELELPPSEFDLALFSWSL